MIQRLQKLAFAQTKKILQHNPGDAVKHKGEKDDNPKLYSNLFPIDSALKHVAREHNSRRYVFNLTDIHLSDQVVARGYNNSLRGTIIR